MRGNMESILLGINIAVVIWAGILSARLWCYRKQMKHMSEQLSLLEKEDTNLQVTSFCHIGKTEDVIEATNRVLARYRETEGALKKVNRTYKESITSISHDIRTPLTSAKGYIQMLQNEDLPEDKKLEYTRIVEHRLDDVTGMLNQLFEYARIEAGEMQLEPEVLNAGNLFAETISMFYEDFLKKGCEPEVEITQTPCRIFADKHAFTRIIENLIRNALVHGTGEYRLVLAQEANQMVLCVSNRTDSIEKQDIERIFERFYTTDQSRSRKTTGLGLAIVKQFTEQMGGAAEASLKEECFTVEIRMPLYKV